VVIAAIFHFMMSQAVGFNKGHTPPIASHDGFIQQILSLIVFLIFWLFVVLTFHFLSEKDQVKKIQLHFDNLKELQFNYTTETTYSWGLWLAIVENLNSFTKILGEKNRLVKSFSKFVTAGVAQQVLRSDNIETKGAVKELTVIMTDIRNFTSISENLKPDQVVTLLNEYFSVMLDVASKFNISVDKFIGDGILAYVDMAESLSDHVTENRKAIDGSIAMIEALDKLNAKLKLLNLPEIKIGIGIYRGPLVIGLIGSESKMQHTIIGDTVNRTARLESLCKELGVSIVVSSQIWHSLNEDLQNRFVSFGKVTVKGITAPMEVFGAN
jgi:class 3 adenylate cyclase